MATGTNLAFNHTTKLIGNGTIDFAAHTFKVILLSATPAATNTLKSQLTAASNLAAATKTLGSVTWTTTSTDDAKFDAADVTFTASGGTSSVKAWAIYDENTTSPLDAPVCYGDVDTAQATVSLAAGEKLKLQFNASGILRLVDSA